MRELNKKQTWGKICGDIWVVCGCQRHVESSTSRWKRGQKLFCTSFTAGQFCFTQALRWTQRVVRSKKRWRGSGQTTLSQRGVGKKRMRRTFLGRAQVVPSRWCLWPVTLPVTDVLRTLPQQWRAMQLMSFHPKSSHVCWCELQNSDLAKEIGFLIVMFDGSLVSGL